MLYNIKQQIKLIKRTVKLTNTKIRSYFLDYLIVTFFMKLLKHQNKSMLGSVLK